VDFGLDETQRAVADLAATVLGGDPDAPRADAALASGLGYDEALWKAAAQAGLLGLALPDDLGGDGFGPVEVGLVLTAAGRQILPLPALATLALGVLPITAFGTDEQRRALLPEVADGRVLTAALRDAPAAPVRADGAGLSGTRVGVLYAEQAHRILVPTDAGTAVLDPRTRGVTLVRSPTSTGAPEYTLQLDRAEPVTVLAAGLEQFDRYAVCGVAAVADGVLAGALKLTADHLRSRVQFGRPLATFQAVAQQVADVYVVARTVHLAAASCAWRLGTDRDGDDDLAVAAYWLARELPRALQVCHHLHGGLGVDVTYPLYRYYSHAKDLARFVGGAATRLDSVGLHPPPSLTRPFEREIATSTGANRSRRLELSDEQAELQATLRDYFARLVTPEEAETLLVTRHGDVYRDVVRRMGRDGWLGVGWPAEYGGHGFGQVEQQIFVNEAARQDIPLPYVTLQTVGPVLQAHGTPEQKDFFLPRILAGELHFAIGYTEPEAGTDLASLRTTAVRDGDHYVVNGQKVFTTGGHDADYVWLACRTDPSAPKHKGISILIVDTTDPGFSWTPTITADGAHHTNTTYYSDVRVPLSMRVGEENEGWRLITSQLNHERVMLGPAGKIAGLAERVREWAAAHGLLTEPDVRRALAETHAIARLNELLNWQVAARTGDVDVADASATKVFASEQAQHVFRLLEEIVGRHGDAADPDTAALAHWLDVQAKRNLVITFGGGVNEVQRELIAQFGLSLPRVPR
jgi:hypothetical protein